MSDPASPNRPEPSALARLLRGSAFIFACRVAGAGLTLLVQLILARSIGATELGVYVLAFSWCVLLANASTLGFIPATVRFIGEGRAREAGGYIRAFARFALRTTLLTALGITLIGVTIVERFGSALIGRDTLIAALAVVPVLAALHLMGGFANGFGRFALGFLPTSLLRPLLFFVLVLIFWVSGHGIDARFTMYLNVAAIVTVALPVIVLSWRLVVRHDRGGDATGRPREWLRAALSLMVAALFTGYFADLIVILAGFYLTNDELAVMNVCLRLAMLITFALFAVDTFTGPQIAYEYAARRLEGLQRTVDRATRLRFGVALAATLAFALLGAPILALFGDAFEAGYPLLLILAAGQLVQGAVGPVVRLMGVSEHQQRCVPVFVACFALAVALVAILAPRYGAIGVAVAAASVMAVWGLALRYLTVRYLGIRPRFL